MEKKLSSPLFFKYLKSYEENPDSRVFAPLAEIYRTHGMIDKAIEVLEHGLKKHPSYILAYLEFANCYFDIGEYQRAYKILRPFVEVTRENIRLQKLYGEICKKIGHLEEALETFKYLLFINPHDKDLIQVIDEIEAEVRDDGCQTSLFQIRTTEEFQIDALSGAPLDDIDEWVEVDLFPKSSQESHFEEEGQQEQHVTDSAPFPSPINAERDHSPVITHTLVDLYCKQGHFKKAEEILEKILLLNPNDEKTLNKLNEIKELEAEINFNVSPETIKAGDEGQNNLMDLYDSKLSTANRKRGDLKRLEKICDSLISEFKNKRI